MTKLGHHFSNGIYVLTTLLGIAAFLYPFWQPTIAQSSAVNQTRADGSVLLLSLLVLLCFAVLLLEVQSKAVNTKTIALLGILVAINVTLRFIETAIPGPGGFSPVFVLIILTGYVYGGGFGFLMGALTIFTSALVTGGVGPWLPYQMYTAGWVGLSTQLCRVGIPWLGRLGWPNAQRAAQSQQNKQRLEILCLAIFGALWGLLYGVIINLWFWPFATGDPAQYWQPGIGVSGIVTRYAAFYMVTSLGWDLLRAVGNSLLIVLLGVPVLNGLRRFHDRFEFRYQPSSVESAL